MAISRLPQRSKEIFLLFSLPLPLSLRSQGCLRVFAELQFDLSLAPAVKSKVENSGWQAGSVLEATFLRRNPRVCGFQLLFGTWGIL